MTESATKPGFTIAIEAMIPQITADVAAQLRERALAGLTHEVTQAVNAEVKRYVAEHIVPEVAAELHAHKAELIAAVVAGVKASALALSDALARHATEKLGGYEGAKVVGRIMAELAPKPY